MGMKKTTSLKTAFWKFLILLLTGLLCAVLIPFGTLLLGTTFGVVTYADYSEQTVKNLAPIIAQTPDLTDIQLPVGCKYLLLDKSFQMLETSLEGEDLQQAMEYATTGNPGRNLNKQYLLVTRENEYVILQYPIGSHFTNEWLNTHLPSPDILLYIVIGVNCVIVSIILTTRFSKNLRTQLLPLFDATAQVSKQNLNFEVGHSKIKEFEEVLASFSDMKENLKLSLESQWKSEQLQKEQIAALAHDLKTPLTVIQGNIDLIRETALDEEQTLYAGYITDSSEQMQAYIKILIEISRASAGYQLCMVSFDLNSFLAEIEAQTNALCQTKEVRLLMEKSNLPEQLTADRILLNRAIMNVVNNAVEHASQGGRIQLDVSGQDGFLHITVSDDGNGFSEEALHHATEQFYMADQSRSEKMHFGMGLYIASSIIEQHSGQIILENAKETGGAKVTLKVPY